MWKSKSASLTGTQMGLTEHEEQLLQGYFRRRTQPYLAALLVLGCGLGVLLSVGMPGRAADPQADAEQLNAQLESVSADLREQFDSEIASMRAELASLSAAMPEEAAKPAKLTDAGARKRIDRVDAGLKKLTKRLDEIEERTASAEAALRAAADRQLVEDAMAVPSLVPDPAFDPESSGTPLE